MCGHVFNMKKYVLRIKASQNIVFCSIRKEQHCCLLQLGNHVLLSSWLDLDAARSAVRDSVLLLALVCVLNDSSSLSHLYTTHTGHYQCYRYSQNIAFVTPTIIYFYHHKMYVKDQSIQKLNRLILKENFTGHYSESKTCFLRSLHVP